MKRILLVAIALVLPASGWAGGGQAGTAGCKATVVRRGHNRALGSLSGSRWIRMRSQTAGIFGVMFGGEVVHGRLALYAGGRNPRTGGNEKILWLLPADTPIASDTRLEGRRLDARGSFVEHLGEASSSDTPGRDFPSIVDVPKAGCWRLTLRSGSVNGQAVALVRRP